MNPKKQWLGVYSSQSDAAGGAAEAAAAGQVVPREDQGSGDHQSSSWGAVGAAGGNSSNKVGSHPVERGSVAASSAGVVINFLFCDLKKLKTISQKGFCFLCTIFRGPLVPFERCVVIK